MPLLPTNHADAVNEIIHASTINDIADAINKLAFNVKAYGATGDGVTDDSTAIQAAIDAASVAAGTLVGGGVVYFPPAVYKINTSLVLKNCVHLLGAGHTSTLTGTANPFIKLQGSGVIPDRMMITGLHLNSPPGAGITIDYTGFTGGQQLGWSRLTIRDVTVNDGVGTAFNIVNGVEMRMHNCVSLRSATGFNLGCTDSYFVSCAAGEGATPWNVAGANNKLVACKAYGGTSNGYTIGGGGRQMLSACEAQDNTGGGYLIASHWNTLSACLADTNQAYGFYIGGNNSRVEGVAMYGGGGSGEGQRVGVVITAGSAGARPTGNVVRVNTMGYPGSNQVPFAGTAFNNDVRVSNTDSAGGRQQTTYAATVTPNPYDAETHEITLTGAITIAEPVYKHQGQRLRFEFAQDGTGGRVVTFHQAFRPNWTPDTTANRRNTITFEYDGRFWQQLAATTGLTKPAAFTDSFTRADGAIGAPWTVPLGTVNVISNKAGSPSTGLAVYDSSDADFDMQMTIGGASGASTSSVFRYIDGTHYAYFSSNTIGTVGGDGSEGGASGVVNAAAGDVVRIIGSGPTITVYKNGVTQWSGRLNFNLAATKHGFLINASNGTIDDFSIV